MRGRWRSGSWRLRWGRSWDPGWVSEDYSLRWWFYINLPVGILSIWGAMSFLRETSVRCSRFDFFGFTTLSLAIGSFQLMLDRAPSKDWFGSPEIWIEACIAAA